MLYEKLHNCISSYQTVAHLKLTDNITNFPWYAFCLPPMTGCDTKTHFQTFIADMQRWYPHHVVSVCLTDKFVHPFRNIQVSLAFHASHAS